MINRHILESFVRESNLIEGIRRDPKPEEVQALLDFINLDKVTVEDMQRFVSINQPGARLRDKHGLNVRVGNHYPMPGGPMVRNQLEFILKQADDSWRQRMAYGLRGRDTKNMPSAWRTHCDYEYLHPFTDGNGRSGRALWLWCLGGYAPLGFLHTFYYQTLSEVGP